MQALITSEALALGLASGPACVASCGPLLVPWSIEQGQRMSRVSAQLGIFVAARFCGYLVFAAIAWSIGRAIPSSSANSLTYGVAHLALGILLAAYAVGRWRHGGCAVRALPAGTVRPPSCREEIPTLGHPRPRKEARSGDPDSSRTWGTKTAGHPQFRHQELVTIGAAPAPSRMWAPLFGFLTGISLCPPFLAAGMRVMEFREFAPAMLFFTMFFVGTLVWFVPFLFFGMVRWKEPVMFVARITLILLAAYYGYLGIVILVGRLLHG